jgi:hypothetical protein
MNSTSQSPSARAAASPAASPAIPDFAARNQAEFEQLNTRLRAQINPQGAVELELFAAYTWALFQAERCRAYEANAAALLEEAIFLDDEKALDRAIRRYDACSRMRIRQERAAARAFAQLGEVQANRLAAGEVEALLRESGIPTPLSPALPVSQLRNKARKHNAFSLAQDVLFTVPRKPETAKSEPPNAPPPPGLKPDAH